MSQEKPTKPAKTGSIFEELAEGESGQLATPSPLTCPKCGETERVRQRSLQFGTHRECLACGFDWPGGYNVAQPDPRFPPPPPDSRPYEEPDPEIDMTPDFRNPLKNYGYDGEDW